MRCVVGMRSTGVCFFFLCVCYAQGLRILCLAPAGSYSHYQLGYRLARGLAERGHDVTLVAPFAEKVPTKNLRTLLLTGFIEKSDEMRKGMNFFGRNHQWLLLLMPMLGSLGNYLVEETFSHEVVQNLLWGNEKFDVVLTEQFIQDGLQAIAHHFGAQSVIYSALPPSAWTNHKMGNPDVPSYSTSPFLEPPVHKFFSTRLINFLFYAYQKLYDHLYFYPKQNRIVQKYLPNSPHIYDIIYNTSLMLLNTDPSYSSAVPMTPNMIEIGGYHVPPAKKLPEDLQKILDNAKNGVVYFSLGSNLKSKDLPTDLREAILRSLSTLNETVLWKYEEDLPEKPDNVIIRKWFPQNDVLGHPNVKLFITHGGLLSTVESLYNAVPVVGIPVFGDQHLNMANAVARGYGLAIDFTWLSEHALTEVLREVLYNPRYAENVKRGSQVLRNKQVSPLDNAEYWINYVVKHNGARHLRPASLELTWYQHISLDVVLFLTVVTLILFFVFYVIIKWCLGRHKPPRKQKKN